MSLLNGILFGNVPQLTLTTPDFRASYTIAPEEARARGMDVSDDDEDVEAVLNYVNALIITPFKRGWAQMLLVSDYYGEGTYNTHWFGGPVKLPLRIQMMDEGKQARGYLMGTLMRTPHGFVDYDSAVYVDVMLRREALDSISVFHDRLMELGLVES